LILWHLLQHGADPYLKDASATAPSEVPQQGLFENVTLPKPNKQKGTGKKAPAATQRPFMEHPSEKEYPRAVEAMADAITRLRALPEWDDWITFSAQGMGHRLDSYYFAQIDMRKEEIRLPHPIPGIDLDRVARRARVARSSLTKVGTDS